MPRLKMPQPLHLTARVRGQIVSSQMVPASKGILYHQGALNQHYTTTDKTELLMLTGLNGSGTGSVHGRQRFIRNMTGMFTHTYYNKLAMLDMKYFLLYRSAVRRSPFGLVGRCRLISYTSKFDNRIGCIPFDTCTADAFT